MAGYITTRPRRPLSAAFVTKQSQLLKTALVVGSLSSIAYGVAFATTIDLFGKCIYSVFAVIILLICWVLLKRKQVYSTPLFLRCSVIWIILIGSVALLRGFSMTWEGSVQLLALEAPKFFIPLFALIGYNYHCVYKMDKPSIAILLLGSLFILAFILLTGGGQGWNRYFGNGVFYSLGFFLILFPLLRLPYQGVVIIASFSYVLNFGLATLRSYIGLFVFFVLAGILHWLIMKTSIYSKLSGLLNATIALGIAIIFLTIGPSSRLMEGAQEAYKRFEDKLMVDSRSYIAERMLQDFTVGDWFVGRGAYGTYDTMKATLGHERTTMEIGYLKLLLQGGLLLVVPVLLLAIPAACAGLFSRNSFCFAMAIIIWGRLLEMIVYGCPQMDASYILFWLAIGICNNRRLRHCSNEYVFTRLMTRSIYSETIANH